jgi:hypothetical protein
MSVGAKRVATDVATFRAREALLTLVGSIMATWNECNDDLLCTGV